MLVNIRRDLALGRMDIESGKEQIDVALAGLTIDKMFQKDVGEILGYLSSISSGIDEVSKEHALLEEKMSEVENLEGNEATMVEALKRSCGSRLKSINGTAGLARRSRSHLW